MFTDTHAHLGFAEFADDLPAVLERAAAAGVTRIVSIAGGAGDSTLAVAGQYPAVWAAVGVHPTEVPGRGLADFERLRPVFDQPRVVAVGETGLDYYRLPGAAGGPPAVGRRTGEEGEPELLKQQQRELFRAHLALARQLRRPVIIHNRSADADLLVMVREHAATVPVTERPWGVMHCFGGTPAMAEACLAAGLLISFTGILTFKNATALRDVAAAVPLSRIMLETDSPYLAPTPHRGRRNEPAHIPLIATALAQVKGVTVAEVARATSDNAQRLFRRMT